MNNMKNPEQVALIDLDGTVADFEKSMALEMAKLAAPGEQPFEGWNGPPHIEARRDLIKRQTGFWRSLPRLELGFEILEEVRAVGFNLHVLTRGPTRTTSAWTEKLEWCHQHIPDAHVTVTQDKSLVYGRVLVDDFPPYFEKWLHVRPRGLVIAVASIANAHVEHPNVVRYDGTNRAQVREALTKAFERRPGSAA